MACFCFLKNVTLALQDGETSYRKRFGSDFSGPLLPFGAKIKYLPVTQKDKERVHKYSDKLLPGIFLGFSWRCRLLCLCVQWLAWCDWDLHGARGLAWGPADPADAEVQRQLLMSHPARLSVPHLKCISVRGRRSNSNNAEVGAELPR